MGTANRVTALKTFATGTENVAAPAVTTLGSNITWTDASDWTELSVYKKDGDVKLTWVDEVTNIEVDELTGPPVNQIQAKKYLKSFSFQVDEVGKSALALDSTATESCNNVTFSGTITRKAWCVEYLGVGILYVPSGRAAITDGGPGGPKSKGSYTVTVETLYTSSFPQGFKFYENTAA